MPRPLPPTFYDRDTVQVARDLLGCRVFRRVGKRTLVARVVETEAYAGPHDLACHASKGRTPRTEVLFGPPGRAYVYLCYGLHWMFNAVTEREGHGSAVLFRAVEPVSGFPAGTRTSGPALLSSALRIDRSENRHDLTAGEVLWIEEPDADVGAIASSPRIGVEYAGEWARRPWRFYLPASPHVSGRRRSSPPRSVRSVVEGPAFPGRTRREDR
jgi:DNA-3-methyladenine glycosylase